MYFVAVRNRYFAAWLLVAGLVTAGRSHAGTITVNNYNLTVMGQSTGIDSDGSVNTFQLSSSASSFTNPSGLIGVSTECGAPTCTVSGFMDIGTFFAQSDLLNMKIGAAAQGAGELVSTSGNSLAIAELQFSVPIVGSIGAGPEFGTVTMALDGGGVADPNFSNGDFSSLGVTARLTACGSDPTGQSVLLGGCVTPDEVDYTASSTFCGGTPNCFGIGSLPGQVQSVFEIDDAHRTLQVTMFLQVNAFEAASVDLSHTATLTITSPPGTTVDFSAFEVSNAPEPSMLGPTLIGGCMLLIFARAKLRSERD